MKDYDLEVGIEIVVPHAGDLMSPQTHPRSFEDAHESRLRDENVRLENQQQDQREGLESQGDNGDVLRSQQEQGDSVLESRGHEPTPSGVCETCGARVQGHQVAKHLISHFHFHRYVGAQCFSIGTYIFID